MFRSLLLTLITFVLSVVAAGAIVFTQTSGELASPAPTVGQEFISANSGR